MIDSQAVYCLECARKMGRSRRDGLISLVVARLDLAVQDPRSSIIPSLTGRNAFSNASLAVNCQDFGELSRAATIDQSLRDENDTDSSQKPLAVREGESYIHSSRNSPP